MPVSVVIPTIGRVEQLESCLESLRRCRPRAAEVIVVDQSHGPAVQALVERLRMPAARVVADEGLGLSRSLNLGVRHAGHEIVMVTNDDCTVDAAWVSEGLALLTEDPGRLVTGQVWPVGDPLAVPSTKVDAERRDFTGEVHWGALYAGNMAFERSAMIAFGGFDEGFVAPAEDNDLCYRWLRSGRRLVYEPRLVLWHHDWRSPEALRRVFSGYARGQGFLAGRHLRSGDLTMLRVVAGDLRGIAAGAWARAVRREPAWRHPVAGAVRALAGGLADGWRSGPTRGATPMATGRSGSDGPINPPFSPRAVRRMRRSRRHPRPTQFDYVHLRRLLEDLRTTLSLVPTPVRSALDLYCGARPYEDLLPADVAWTAFDVDDGYGVADVVSREFLPFDDDAFDLVLCTEAFQFVPEPERAATELRRVLRPGGTLIITIPLVWEYDRRILERRYTGPELAHLFRDWDDVCVVENGGRTVAWTTLTGWLVSRAQARLERRSPALRAVRPAFAAIHLGLNGLGATLERLDRAEADSPRTLPMNLLLSARRPASG